VGRFFRPASALGYGLVVSLGLPLRLHTMPYVSFYALWCVLLPPWCKNRNLGELGLWSIVPIRTVLGTMAVLVDLVVAVVVVRNYTGVVIGTESVLADLLWLVCIIFDWSWCDE